MGRSAVYGLLSFLLFIASLPPIGLLPAGLLFGSPIYFCSLRCSAKRSASEAAIFGFLAAAYIYLGALSGSGIIYIFLVAVLSSGFALLGCIASLAARAGLLPWICMIGGGSALLVQGLEAIRVPFSFSIVLLAWLPAAQLIELAGATLAGGLLAVLHGSVAIAAARVKVGRSPAWTLGLTAVAVISCAVYGDLRLRKVESDQYQTVAVGVVQTNHFPWETAHAAASGVLERFSSERKALTASLAGNRNVDITVWPESAIPGLPLRVGRAREWINDLHLPALVHIYDVDNAGRLISAVHLLDHAGRSVSKHEKTTTVPIAETLLAEGEHYRPHAFANSQIGSLICLESAFSGPARRMVQRGANWLSISTNDAYLGPSFLPLLHFDLARLRAIELRRSIARSANGGLSGFIHPSGRVLAQMPVFTSGAITANLPLLVHKSFYSSHFVMVESVPGLALLLGALTSVRGGRP